MRSFFSGYKYLLQIQLVKLLQETSPLLRQVKLMVLVSVTWWCVFHLGFLEWNIWGFWSETPGFLHTVDWFSEIPGFQKAPENSDGKYFIQLFFLVFLRHIPGWLVKLSDFCYLNRVSPQYELNELKRSPVRWFGATDFPWYFPILNEERFRSPESSKSQGTLR